MNNVEFDTAFDVMYNNITSNQAPGLNLYEKSLFLTQAQSHIIREYFNPRIDQAGGGYDGNQKRQYDFSCITKHAELTEVHPDSQFDQRAVVYKFPADWFLTLNEQLTLAHTETVNGVSTTTQRYLIVSPLSLNEYDRLMSKPYKFPNKEQAWRIITENTWVDRTVEPEYDMYDYDFWFIIEESSHNDPDVHIEFYRRGSASNYEARYSRRNSPSYYSRQGTTFFDIPESWTIRDTMSYVMDYILEREELMDDDYSIEYNNDSENIKWEYSGYTERQPIFSMYMRETRNSDTFMTFTKPTLELIFNNANNDSVEYRMRYIRKPKPIILADISTYNVSIDGETQPFDYIDSNIPCECCELPEVLHKEILERAVVMAKSVWMANTQQQNNQNERSER